MKNLLSAVAVLFAVATLKAQKDTKVAAHNITVVIPTVVLLDIEGTGNLTANFKEAGSGSNPEAGLPIEAPADLTGNWINYSSVKSGSTLKKVTVAVDKVIPGLDVKVVAGASTSGAGDKGTPQAQLTLSTSAQDLIKGIGTAYTEDGDGKGHQLTYSFGVSSNPATYKDIVAKSNSLTVTYTIGDE